MKQTEKIKAAALAWTRGRELLKAGRYAEAEPQVRLAMKAMPKSADLLSDYATIAEKLCDWRAAAFNWQEVAKLAPDRAVGDHIGLALLQLDRNAEAAHWLESFVENHPLDAQSTINLAVAYTRLARDDEAIALLEKFVHQQPHTRLAWEALVTLQINSARAQAAASTLASALRYFPADAELHYLLMDHLLKDRQFSAGFELFDARWRTRFCPGAINIPKDRRWRGEAFNGTLLVRAEQGLGDELLYSHNYADLAQRHLPSVIECDDRLKPLLQRSLPSLSFISRPSTAMASPPPWDKDIMAGDLCCVFRNKQEYYPVKPGWLQADAARVVALRQHYQSQHGNALRVGISWRSKHPQHGAVKSLTLTDLLPLLQIPGVVFFDIQYGDTAIERAKFSEQHGIALLRDETIDPMQNIDGLAAQMGALDLVISTSNSTVHLAGSLGRPTMLMLHCDRGLPWYWAYSGTQVPWYPSTEIFRCPSRGLWQPVITDVATRLRQRATTAL